MLEQVKASAGSGKTYELTARFLDLLLSSAQQDTPPACGREPGTCHGWPEIMAVTFTNKAAAEMKERVIQSLKARALDLDAGPAQNWPKDQATFWLTRILRHYNQLNIRTIDSLLNLLMRIFALEVGVTPDFEVLFDIEEIFEQLFDRITTRAEAADGTERQVLQATLRALLAQEQQAGFLMGNTFRKRLIEALRFRLFNPSTCETNPETILRALPPSHAKLIVSVNDLAAVSEPLSLKKQFQGLLDKLQSLGISQAPPTSAFLNKDSLGDCVLAASRDSVTAEQELAFATLQIAHKEFSNARKILVKASNLAGFIQLADMLAQLWEQTRSKHNALLNAQCARMAQQQLSGEFGVPDAFCRMGSRLYHMLVDEFQDTSRDQWQALTPLAEECLAKGGNVFFVGDVKQAIYGWRGGDSQLFDEVMTQPGLCDIAQSSCGFLPNNWRSAELLTDFYNHVFGALENTDNAQRVAEAMLGTDAEHGVGPLTRSITEAFAQANQAVPPPKQGRKGLVRLTQIEADDKAMLFEEIRDTLEQTLESLFPRRSYGDAAILVRSNTEAAQVADWCIGWGIPVITENSLSLGEHPIVRQLLAYLRFMDYPLNDLALWQVLSGEEIFLEHTGQDKAAFTDWLADQQNGSLYPKFMSAFPELGERHLARYVKKAGFMTPYDAVMELCDNFQILERHPEAAPFVRRFMEVIHAAEESGHQSLASFLDFWDQNGAEERVPLPDAIDAVRIMTIHQSKGLQFPVVVIPFHHWRFVVDGDPIPVDYDGLQLLVPLCRELGQPYIEQAARTLLEQLNLLYVAWTRAEEELHGFLTSTPYYRSQSALVRAMDALLEGLPFELGETGTHPEYVSGELPADELKQPPVEQEPLCPTSAPAACAVESTADSEPMSWLPRLKIHRHFSQDMPRETLLPDATTFDARARGTLIHDVLDRLRQNRDTLNPQHALQSAISAHAQVLPDDETARTALCADIEDILDWVLALPDFSGWISRGYPECPILDESGNEHRPDLLVLDEAETIVVEYKTGAPSPDHEAQVRRYMKLLAAMQPVAPSMRAVIIYLDERRTTEVRP